MRGYRGNALDAGGFLPSASWSGREGLVDADGNQRYYVASLEEIEAELAITRGEIAASATPVGSLQEHGAANYLGQTATERIVATANTRRTLAAAELRKWTRIVATVRGSLHDWLSLQIVELRYGVVLETAFDRARARVDGYLARYAPEVGRALAAALERSDSDDPEAWSQALTSCRRTLKALADSVYPATGEVVDGHKLDDEHYLNRLTEFVKQRVESDSQTEVLEEDIRLAHRQAEALNTLASKGVHSGVDEIDLEMALVRTYFLAGDILRLVEEQATLEDQSTAVEEITAEPSVNTQARNPEEPIEASPELGSAGVSSDPSTYSTPR